MARMCGVCRQPPREGQEMRAIRLAEEDLPDTEVQEVGLYHACLDCVEQHRTRLAKRLGVETLSNNELC